MNLLFLAVSTIIAAQNKKPLAIEDLMTFRHIESPVISSNGRWVAHVSKPDRGDPQVLVYSKDRKQKYILDLASEPEISYDEKWVVAKKEIPLLEKIRSDKKNASPPAGMILLNLVSGETKEFVNVRDFSFSNDGRWLVYHLSEKDKKNGTNNNQPSDHFKQESDEESNLKKKKTGNTLQIYDLRDGSERMIHFVHRYKLDSTSIFLAYSIADTTGHGNGVFILDLENSTVPPDPLSRRMTWKPWN